MNSLFQKIASYWHRIFLIERASLNLSLFRLAVAFTVGSHVIPSLINLPETYYSTAYKSFNTHFFPLSVIEWVLQSPEWLITTMAIFFLCSWLSFFVGFFTQISTILMTLCCYYFYALNAFHVGTLSWDILLVTLFLMSLTSYPGDYFSIDALRKTKISVFQKRRPYFIQRLLQCQIGFTFFYTALYKVTAEGNWITDNPLYYVLNYPAPGVTKHFLFRDFFSSRPDLCYFIGLIIVIFEFAMIFLLFCQRTRRIAIYLGFIFHFILIYTLNVPATFFFLFPAQMLLFLNPDETIAWIQKIRNRYKIQPLGQLFYDGDCGFCQRSVNMIQVMDLGHTLQYLDFRTSENLEKYHKDLQFSDLEKQIYLVDFENQLWGGFFAIRRLSWWLPMMWPLLFLWYLPGTTIIGQYIYRWVAKNRFKLSKQSCQLPE